DFFVVRDSERTSSDLMRRSFSSGLRSFQGFLCIGIFFVFFNKWHHWNLSSVHMQYIVSMTPISNMPVKGTNGIVSALGVIVLLYDGGKKSDSM
ncbi:MAG: hypothetical protein ACE5R7_06145, partial [Nitrosarchaeum sp.]